MYDPALGRFVSPDSIVPGAASGAGGGAATLGVDSSSQLKALMVDFHEPGFVATLNDENQQRFWFQISDEEKQKAKSPWGPRNPQALNRYSYVLNNPLRYVDPSGHLGVTFYSWGGFTLHLTHEEANIIWGIATATDTTVIEKGLKIGQFLAKSLGSALAQRIMTALAALEGAGSDYGFIIGAYLKVADLAYGNKGVDLLFTPLGGGIALAPTLDRQQGVYYDSTLQKIINSAKRPPVTNYKRTPPVDAPPVQARCDYGYTDQNGNHMAGPC